MPWYYRHATTRVSRTRALCYAKTFAITHSFFIPITAAQKASNSTKITNARSTFSGTRFTARSRWRGRSRRRHDKLRNNTGRPEIGRASLVSGYRSSRKFSILAKPWRSRSKLPKKNSPEKRSRAPGTGVAMFSLPTRLNSGSAAKAASMTASPLLKSRTPGARKDFILNKV